jgi:hypoxanthine phosphoribosyltransferase
MRIVSSIFTKNSKKVFSKKINPVIMKKYQREGRKMEEVKVLINEAKLDARLNELAKEIMKDYKNEDIVFVGVLRGAATFMVELAKRIKNNVEYEFIQLESYEGDKSTGVVKLRQELTGKIEGKNIIIIEDIIDTGRTLEYLREHIKKFSPKSVKICTLLSKPSRRIFELDVDYIGFSIPDEFVVGFGMDYNQRYRNLPYVGKIG